VRKGEEGSTVVFWRLKKVNATAETYPTTDEPDLPDRVIPLLRAYTVFNVAQVDGLPPDLSASSTPAWEPEARAEELLLMSGATIRHGGAQAYYRPGTDEIQLPPRQWFPRSGSYYATALHELTHWSSHRRSVFVSGLNMRSRKQRGSAGCTGIERGDRQSKTRRAAVQGYALSG
jgi:antirestriction protein ArdC